MIYVGEQFEFPAVGTPPPSATVASPAPRRHRPSPSRRRHRPRSGWRRAADEDPAPSSRRTATTTTTTTPAVALPPGRPTTPAAEAAAGRRRRRSASARRPCCRPACWRWSRLGAASGCVARARGRGSPSRRRRRSPPSGACARSTPASACCASTSPSVPRPPRSSTPAPRSPSCGSAATARSNWCSPPTPSCRRRGRAPPRGGPCPVRRRSSCSPMRPAPSARPASRSPNSDVDADGRDVLVDLEALGVLSIVAPNPLADAVVRGIAATLATSIFAEVANLDRRRPRRRGVPRPSPRPHRGAASTRRWSWPPRWSAPPPSAKQSTFVLRARHTSGEAWEPAIVLAASAVAGEVTPDVVRSAARRRGGLAVVAAGAPGAPWCSAPPPGAGRSSRSASGSSRSGSPWPRSRSCTTSSGAPTSRWCQARAAMPTVPTTPTTPTPLPSAPIPAR